MSQKPTLSFGQIWNLNFGFLGLQIVFTLVMSNTSRILSALGAKPNELPLLWLAPPLAGLIIQPIIGYLSDRKWTRFGRRIPYIFIGSIILTILIFIISSSTLSSQMAYPILGGVCILFLLQGAINITMQPFRSLVGDMLNDKQKNLGYSVQTIISNIGGIAGSFLPFILTFIGLTNHPMNDNKIAPTVTWSFYIGGTLLLVTSLWTCFTVKEYPPKEMGNTTVDANDNRGIAPAIVDSVISTLLRLGVVQFFSWFGIFFLWVYTTDALAGHIWHTQDPLSEAYNQAGNWFGVLSGVYSVVTVIYSVFLAKLADRLGRKNVYAISLLLAAVSIASIYFIRDQYLLLLPMVGIGIGWASILTFPFSILASITPPKKMGLNMGLLNATITIPQITAGLLGGLLFKYIMNEDSISMMLISGASLLLAAICVVFIKDREN